MLYSLTVGKFSLGHVVMTEDVLNELDQDKCGVMIGSAMGGMKVHHLEVRSLSPSSGSLSFCWLEIVF